MAATLMSDPRGLTSAPEACFFQALPSRKGRCVVTGLNSEQQCC